MGKRLPGVTVALLLLAGACTATPPPAPAPTRSDDGRSTASSLTPPTPTSAPQASATPTVPASAPSNTFSPVPSPDAAAIRRTVERFNAADGTVAAQQKVVVDLVDPAQRSIQSRCPKATTTLELEPVWSALAAAPAWRPSAGEMSGVVYSLPTLIRIHRAGRISGTDLTDLHLAVSTNGSTRVARLVALCIS